MAISERTRKNKERKDPNINKEDPSNKRGISRGQARFKLLSDAKKYAEEYTSQAQQEASKAGKRSLWQGVGSIIGGLAVPLMLTPAGALGVGLATAAGAYGGGKLARGQAERTGGKREDIKVDKFYDKKADEANIQFKQFDKNLESSLRNQSLAAGVTAGVLKSGAVQDFKSGLKETFMEPGSKSFGQKFKGMASGVKEKLGDIFQSGAIEGIDAKAGADLVSANIAEDVAEQAVEKTIDYVPTSSESTYSAYDSSGKVIKPASDIRKSPLLSANLTSDVKSVSVPSVSSIQGSLSNESLFANYGKDLVKQFGMLTAANLLEQATSTDDTKLYENVDWKINWRDNPYA